MGASGQWSATDDGLVASLRVGAQHADVTFRADGVSLRPSEDALLPLLLPLAMQAGVPVERLTGVSLRLAATVPLVQALLVGWFPDLLTTVDVDVETGPVVSRAPGTTACFFTGGLDSFCEVVRRRGDIDDLVYVQGFDVPPGDETRAREARSVVQAVADELGARLVVVDTDLRTFSDGFLRWEEYHGAALGAVASMLSDTYSRAIIASSHGGVDLSAWGSHPVLDPLWSTERVEVVHSGYGLTRLDKAAIVAQSEVALRWLRVCYLPPEGCINCGACEKCLRTAVNLRAVGALERCATLPTVSVEQLSGLRLDEGSRARWELNRDGLRRRGDAPELVAAIDVALQRSDAGSRGGATERVTRGRRFGVRQVRRLRSKVLRPPPQPSLEPGPD